MIINKLGLIILSCLSLTSCSKPLTVEEQIKQMKACEAAGYVPVRSLSFGSIRVIGIDCYRVNKNE